MRFMHMMYSQWAMKTFNLFAAASNAGLDLVDEFLDQDARNNSAWNHRYFILNNTTSFTEQTVAAEVECAMFLYLAASCTLLPLPNPL